MDFFRKSTAKKNADQKGNLTEGPIAKGLFTFMIPIFLGQLLQQLYNMADAWVVGNFASNDAFAAVSLSGNVTMSVITLFGGIAIGGGVVISKYFGAQDEENLQRAVHTNFLLGIVFSILATIIGQVFVPILLGWLHTPDSVMTEARLYFGIYFAGVSTVIMYNICMNIMRAVGDSVHPLYYLIFSSVVNMILDLIFVAGFKWSAAGAAVATVIAQGLSVLLCLSRMVKDGGAATIHWKELRFHKEMIRIHKEHEALRTGAVVMLHCEKNILAYGRFTEEEQIIVILNNRNEDREVEIEVWKTGISRLKDSVLKRIMLSYRDGYTTEEYEYTAKAGVIRVPMPAFGAMVLYHKCENPTIFVED